MGEKSAGKGRGCVKEYKENIMRTEMSTVKSRRSVTNDKDSIMSKDEYSEEQSECDQ